MNRIFTKSLNFKDDEGRIRIFNGMNIDDKEIGSVFRYDLNEDFFKKFRANGFNLIRLAFVANGTAKDLLKLAAEMDKLGVTLVALHDRPEKTELGNYYYLIECSDCSYEKYQKLTDGSNFTFRYLGSYSVK